MDDIDLANQHAEMFQQQALREHFSRDTFRGAAGGPGLHATTAGPGSKEICIDCGEKIEAARLKAHPLAVRCIDCQTKKERQ